MINKIKNNLMELCSMTEAGLLEFLEGYLEKYYDHVFATENYIIAEGDIPVALVAHLDTVFKIPPFDFYYDGRKKVLWSPDGLGTDDRAGVCAILEIISRGLKPHIIFTTEEEKGGIGAQILIEENPLCPFEELNFIIELDRQGKQDCVFYDCNNGAFTKFIKQQGFELHIGSFTDISVIAPQWGVAAVNLSVGYENEHSYAELIHIDHLILTIERVCKILKMDNLKSYSYVPRARVRGGTYGWITGGSCVGCGRKLGANEGIKVQDLYISTLEFKLCPKCYNEFYGPSDLIPIGSQEEWADALAPDEDQEDQSLVNLFS